MDGRILDNLKFDGSLIDICLVLKLMLLLDSLGIVDGYVARY